MLHLHDPKGRIARLEKLARSAWCWKAVATVLGVLFLLLLLLGVVSFVGAHSLEAERRARAAAEAAAARQRQADRERLEELERARLGPPPHAGGGAPCSGM